jgi:hypothetical protein
MTSTIAAITNATTTKLKMRFMRKTSFSRSRVTGPPL